MPPRGRLVRGIAVAAVVLLGNAAGAAPRSVDTVAGVWQPAIGTPVASIGDLGSNAGSNASAERRCHTPCEDRREKAGSDYRWRARRESKYAGLVPWEVMFP